MGVRGSRESIPCRPQQAGLEWGCLDGAEISGPCFPGGALAAQCAGGSYYTKWVVIVDEDVDPTDLEQVIWAMSTRCSPTEDIDILRNTWSTSLILPEILRRKGLRVQGVDQGMQEFQVHQDLLKAILLRESVYKKVKEKWGKLGFKTPPRN